MRSCGGLALVVTLFALEGCYRFVPVAATQPLPRTYVTAALTDVGSAELGSYLGHNVTSVGGRLVSSSPEELHISVFTVTVKDGQESFWKGEMVTLPRRLVAGIQERKFSGSRSGLVATLGLVAGVGLLRAFGVLSAGGSSSGGGGVVTK